MKLNGGNKYLCNIAPGWFVVFRVHEVVESSDGTGGHYWVTEYAHCDFTSAAWTECAKAGPDGKPQGPDGVQGAVQYRVPSEVRMGIVDALILQWMQLE